MTKVNVDSDVMRFFANCEIISNNDVRGCPIHKYSVCHGKAAQVSFDDNGVCTMHIDGRNIQDLVEIRQICLNCAKNQKVR